MHAFANPVIAPLLAGCLALALLAAGIGDLRSRTIPNWLNAGIALAAPLWWWATGMAIWPELALQIGFALTLFALFAAAFAAGAMGGGDVKLIAALGLWLPPVLGLRMLMLMSLAGGVLTLVMLALRALARRGDVIEVPYGVAIAFAGLAVLGQRYLYLFG